jgi:hypothetical protein
MSAYYIHETVSLQDEVTESVFQCSEFRITQPSTLLSVHAASDQTSALGRNKGTSTFRVFSENRLISEEQKCMMEAAGLSETLALIAVLNSFVSFINVMA